jgi:hypothetical protein
MRQQVGWMCLLMLASSVLLLMQAVGILSDFAIDWLLLLLPPAMVAAITVAVLQYQLYDIRIVVRRVVVYGGLTVVLTAAFITVYFGVLAGVSGHVTGPHYRWAPVAAATVVVLLAEPARRRLQALLEHRVLGERGDPLRALARLQATVSARDEEFALTTIAQTVASALRSPGVALALHRAADVDAVALIGQEAPGPLIVPLLHRGEKLGELRISPRTPGEP